VHTYAVRGRPSDGNRPRQPGESERDIRECAPWSRGSVAPWLRVPPCAPVVPWLRDLCLPVTSVSPTSVSVAAAFL
jgi:hypothetical protein